MTSTNLSAVIPPVESILCPDCGDNVTIAPHSNSYGIAGMDDCLYHGQCSNIVCQNSSMKKKVFLVSIACQSMSDRSVNDSVTRTFTICPDKGETQGRNSYFMSLSCNGEDHSEIEMLIHNELNVLSNEGKMLYHGGLKHIIKVKIGKLFLCVD